MYVCTSRVDPKTGVTITSSLSLMHELYNKAIRLEQEWVSVYHGICSRKKIRLVNHDGDFSSADMFQIYARRSRSLNLNYKHHVKDSKDSK